RLTGRLEALGWTLVLILPPSADLCADCASAAGAPHRALTLSGPLRRLRRWAMVAFTWPIEWPPGKVLSRLRDAENAHDQLDQVTEPERLADKACISLDVGAHARLRYGAHNDAGDVAVRLGCPHRVEQPCTIKHRHHEV